MHCVVSVLEMRLHPDQEEKPSLNLWNSRVFREVLKANEARLAIPFVVVVLKVSLIAGFDLVFVCALRMGMRSIPTSSNGWYGHRKENGCWAHRRSVIYEKARKVKTGRWRCWIGGLLGCLEVDRTLLLFRLLMESRIKSDILFLKELTEEWVVGGRLSESHGYRPLSDIKSFCTCLYSKHCAVSVLEMRLRPDQEEKLSPNLRNPPGILSARLATSFVIVCVSSHCWGLI